LCVLRAKPARHWIIESGWVVRRGYTWYYVVAVCIC
jgi:hypothetical protein